MAFIIFIVYRVGQNHFQKYTFESLCRIKNTVKLRFNAHGFSAIPNLALFFRGTAIFAPFCTLWARLYPAVGKVS